MEPFYGPDPHRVHDLVGSGDADSALDDVRQSGYGGGHGSGYRGVDELVAQFDGDGGAPRARPVPVADEPVRRDFQHRQDRLQLHGDIDGVVAHDQPGDWQRNDAAARPPFGGRLDDGAHRHDASTHHDYGREQDGHRAARDQQPDHPRVADSRVRRERRVRVDRSGALCLRGRHEPAPVDAYSRLRAYALGHDAVP